MGRSKTFSTQSLTLDEALAKQWADKAIGGLAARGWSCWISSSCREVYFERRVERERDSFYSDTLAQWEKIEAAYIRLVRGEKREYKAREPKVVEKIVTVEVEKPESTCYVCCDCGCETPKRDRCCFVCGAVNPAYKPQFTADQINLLQTLLATADHSEHDSELIASTVDTLNRM